MKEKKRKKVKEKDEDQVWRTFIKIKNKIIQNQFWILFHKNKTGFGLVKKTRLVYEFFFINNTRLILDHFY